MDKEQIEKLALEAEQRGPVAIVACATGSLRDTQIILWISEAPPIGTKLYIHPQPTSKWLIQDIDRIELQSRIRKILIHHGITKVGDGVIEADLLDALLTAAP